MLVHGHPTSDPSTIQLGKWGVYMGSMSRGRHTVAAKVVNEQGEEVIETGPVGFYVLRNALGGR